MLSLFFFSMLFIKEARIKMNYQASTNKKMQHESQLSAKKADKLFFNGKRTRRAPPELSRGGRARVCRQTCLLPGVNSLDGE